MKQEVQIVNEELLGLKKEEYLVNPQQEKILRASLKSNVEKYINSQRVVIIDSMNYFKSFRYELYCLARNAQTTLCLVWCDSDIDTAGKIVTKGGYENPFPVDLFEDYCNRLERPDQGKRWDKPLFQLRTDEETPFQDIAKALLSGEKPRDPVSTKPVSICPLMTQLSHWYLCRLLGATI